LSETLWIAIITACATTIPNIVIAIINNKHFLKIKRIENYNEARQKVIFEFLENVGGCCGSAITMHQKQEYQKSLNKLLLYFPNINSSTLDKIYNSLFDSNISNKTAVLTPLIKELSIVLSDKSQTK